jgi:hypothetical protein
VNRHEINLVPLQQASLCLDCEAITAGHTTCLCCGSQALLNIARILNQRVFDEGRSPKSRELTFSSLRSRTGSRVDPEFDLTLTNEQNDQLRYAWRLGKNSA